MTTTTASDIDIAIGANIRTRRMLRGIDRPSLAMTIGVSPQQVAQIEHGSRRCSPGRLLAIAKALDATIESLMDAQFLRRDPEDLLPTAANENGLRQRLLAAFDGLADPQRDHLVAMAEALSHPT